MLSAKIANAPKGVPGGGKVNKRKRQRAAAEYRSGVASAERKGAVADSWTGHALAANSAGVAIADPSSANNSWHRY